MPTPAAAAVWLRELDPDKGETTLDRAVPKLRDEVTAVMMDRTRGHSRELALALTKLDEAHQWITAYLQTTGEVVVIPRAELLRAAHTDETPVTTHATDAKGAPDGI